MAMRAHWAIPVVIGIAVMMVFSSIPAYVAANSDNASDKAKFKIPAHAVKVAEGVYSLGKAKDVDGKAVEGIMFIHPKNEPAKPDKPDKPDKPGKGGGGKKGGGGLDCWAFIAKGAKWKMTEPYILATTNSDGLASVFVADTISASLETWDGKVDFDIFDPEVGGIVDGVDTASPDGKNEVLFGDIDEPNVIASTIIWRTIGPPQLRQFVEWDMIFDQTKIFTWGNVDDDSSFMDLENIATHEAGHAAGMAHPDNSCTEETMYAFAALGETKKRILNSGDIAGIQELYG